MGNHRPLFVVPFELNHVGDPQNSKFTRNQAKAADDPPFPSGFARAGIDDGVQFPATGREVVFRPKTLAVD